jgi:hypothetical protein
LENNPDDYYLPANLTKSELEDRLEGGFDRLAREASEAKTVDLSLPESI